MAIYVGGTAEVNKLDDYEEGSWTPSYRYGASVTISGNTNGEYVKVGSIVYIRGYIQNTSVTGGQSWQADIAGLPFLPNTVVMESMRLAVQEVAGRITLVTMDLQHVLMKVIVQYF